ncbi:hypothetical protein M427DRAFT_272688 [Gonapodya prolifera JEL478]|uniref:BAR domain-containing protein n=1 Tax=Gonapodya prolifera (strain JEL478) TaxID=1344416 RepID=A0A139AXQ1_GONPJ|nr:hypothetical protein M427DRAFT_272688 [Gonapodya prolifera JEL478]|eukprot:KXS21531.1 hypothetical protein M427DRAFT_272688 [Gonapodya prolifera JEL478]
MGQRASRSYLDAQERFVLSMEEVYSFAAPTDGKESSHLFIKQWQKFCSGLARGSAMREVDDAINRRIMPMLDAVVDNLKGPAAVIKKRDKKRLDYERVKELTATGQKPSELLVESSANYELLNDQLLEEIPILRDLVNDYLDIILAEYVEVQRKAYEAISGLSEVAAEGEELGVIGVLAGSAQACDWEGIRATFAARMSQVRDLFDALVIPKEWTEETFSLLDPSSANRRRTQTDPTAQRPGILGIFKRKNDSVSPKSGSPPKMTRSFSASLATRGDSLDQFDRSSIADSIRSSDSTPNLFLASQGRPVSSFFRPTTRPTLPQRLNSNFAPSGASQMGAPESVNGGDDSIPVPRRKPTAPPKPSMFSRKESV